MSWRGEKGGKKQVEQREAGRSKETVRLCWVKRVEKAVRGWQGGKNSGGESFESCESELREGKQGRRPVESENGGETVREPPV